MSIDHSLIHCLPDHIRFDPIRVRSYLSEARRRVLRLDQPAPFDTFVNDPILTNPQVEPAQPVPCWPRPSLPVLHTLLLLTVVKVVKLIPADTKPAPVKVTPELSAIVVGSKESVQVLLASCPSPPFPQALSLPWGDSRVVCE